MLRRRPAAVLFVTDPARAMEAPADRLARIFELTPAEARLAVALVAGQPLDRYAEHAAITIGTARWTLKRVLLKTGCRRQSELVHLLSTSAAALVRV